MYNRNYIWFSLNLAKEDIASKDKLEALAFCVSIKAMYVSSTLMSADITSIMKTFHIGHIKAKRILSNAIRFGYIKIENGSIIVSRIKEERSFNIKLSTKNKSIYLKLDNVKKIIQQSILLNHIKKQNKVEDIQRIVTTAKNTKHISKKDYALYKKAVKDLKRYAVDEKKCFYGLSYNKIASLLSISKDRAIQLINIMVSDGTLNKKVSSKELICSKKESSNTAYEFFKAKFNNSFVFITRNGAIYKQESNCYRLNNYFYSNIDWMYSL